MGKMNGGILGQVTNKVGNTVCSTWKGINTVRGYQPNVTNRRTAGQIDARQKLTMTSRFGSSILATLIFPLWNRFAKKASGYNDWFKSNISAFNADGTVSAVGITISQGKMIAPEVTGVSATGTTCTVQFNTVPGDVYALPTDEVYMLLLTEDFRVISSGKATGTRVGGTSTLPNPLSDTVKFIYVAFRRVDGTVVSNTGFLSN